MPATEELQIHVRMDGLSDVRRLDDLLSRIEARIEHLNARAQELGVPLSMLIELARTEEDPS